MREAMRVALNGSKLLTARSFGYGLRGQDGFGQNAVVARIPQSLADAELSVCGVKGFMADELREFNLPGRGTKKIRCATIAVLEITDSPVHIHSLTLEVYAILSGEGQMVLDDRVINIKVGDVILLPPGVQHGVMSHSFHIPVKVLMTFTPGLAPKTELEHRDEQIVADLTSQRIRELTEA
jgi:mannose-6-phosphate isomerase-like protein (cupin superfamily)